MARRDGVDHVDDRGHAEALESVLVGLGDLGIVPVAAGPGEADAQLHRLLDQQVSDRGTEVTAHPGAADATVPPEIRVRRQRCSHLDPVPRVLSKVSDELLEPAAGSEELNLVEARSIDL